MKIHPVFHVSLLQLAAPRHDYLPGQHVPPPEPVVVNNEEEYVVESVEGLCYNKRRKRHKYYIKWTGYDKMTWEPAAELKDTTAVTSFYERYPNILELPEVI